MKISVMLAFSAEVLYNGITIKKEEEPWKQNFWQALARWI